MGGIPRDSGKEKGKIGQNIREQKDDMKTREWGEQWRETEESYRKMRTGLGKRKREERGRQ